MQALSIWSWKRDFFAAPYLDSDLTSSCIAKEWRRKKRWGTFLDSRKGCDLACNSREFCRFSHRRVLDLQKGFFLDCSKLNYLHVLEQKKFLIGAPFASIFALEQEGSGSETAEVPDSNCMISEKFDNSEVKDLEDIVGIDDEENCDNGSKLGEEKSVKIDVRALALSLRSARTADDIDDVLKNLEELPLPVYSSIIRGFGREKKLDSAIALVEWLKRKRKDSHDFIGPNLFIYNSLLGAVKQSEQFGMVDRVMEDMVAQGVFPNVVTYNTLMSIYLERGHPNQALDVMAEIQKKGLSLSPVTYSTALLAYRRMEDANGALRFFTEVRDKYMNRELRDADENLEQEYVKLEKFVIRICYQVMRRWLVKGDLLTDNVLKLLSGMDNAGLHLSRADYERLIWACTRERHFVVAKDLYRRIREDVGDISLSVCNHVIWLMGKAKKWWAALEIYEDLLDKGPKPNNLSYELIVSHFNVLLSAASRKGIWRWGVRLINKMQDKGLKPGSREWNAVLVACSRASETSAAVQVFKRMVEQGEKPTILSYGALLSALEKGKMYDEALRVWEHMCKVGVKPNLHAYTILVSVHIGQGRPGMVDSVIHDMSSSGIEPSVVTYNAIISGCAKNGMGSDAFEWFHRMKVQNIKPNEITYEMLIEALTRDEKPRLAYEMYLRAHNEGLHLSSKAYDAVIQSSRCLGASMNLNALGPRPPDKKRNVKTRKDLSEFCNFADVPRRSKPFDTDEIYAYKTQENQ